MEYKRLGDYIREVNVRNRDLKVTNLLGMSISKKFIPSIANIIGTDMSTYKIIKRNQFAYVPVTSRNGEKITIALLDCDDEAIISQAYTVFEIVPVETYGCTSQPTPILPEYLMMWFHRPEFDRYARFHSHGSAREVFDWDELCEVRLPIPSITRQREIVSEYETLTNRIRLNEQMIARLEETAQALYRKMFVDGIDKENLPEGWRRGKLGDYAKVRSGYAFHSEWWQKEGVPVIKISDICNNTINPQKCDCVSLDKYEYAKNYTADKGDIVIAMTGATLGKIAVVPQDGLLVNQRVGLFNLGLMPMKRAPYLYWLIKQEDIQKELVTVGGDSAQANISNSNIEDIEVAIAPKSRIDDFNREGEVLLASITLKNKENLKLTELQSLLLTIINHVV